MQNLPPTPETVKMSADFRVSVDHLEFGSLAIDARADLMISCPLLAYIRIHSVLFSCLSFVLQLNFLSHCLLAGIQLDSGLFKQTTNCCTDVSCVC